MNTKKLWIVLSLFVMTAFSQTSFAQGLNWDGQTGALLTPFAYTAASPAGKLGKPEISFHYLNTGSVIGNNMQFSVTEGIAKRFEVGFTQSFSAAGSVNANAAGLGLPLNVTTANGYPAYIQPASSLFSNGYSGIHGKLTVISENSFKTKWVPAIAVGAIGRFGAQRVSYYTTGSSKTQTNGDFYIVATKTVTQVKGLPFVLSIGDKVTDASVMGVAGNAGDASGNGVRWQGRAFGAVAIVVKGPAKSALIIGSEVAQQPHYIQGLNSFCDAGASALLGTAVTGLKANIPTSESYFVRIVPHLEGSPMEIDLGVAHVGGNILKVPTVAALNIGADARFGMGVSYHF